MFCIRFGAQRAPLQLGVAARATVAKGAAEVSVEDAAWDATLVWE